VAQQQGVDSTVYYVSPAGDDVQNGKTEAQALKTLTKAFEKIKPGGEIRILPGEYHEHLGLEKLGSVAARVTVQNNDFFTTKDRAWK